VDVVELVVVIPFVMLGPVLGPNVIADGFVVVLEPVVVLSDVADFKN